jgi:hypothetical protein
VIVVATDDFEVYHGVVNELRDRGATFTTVGRDASLPDGTAVVVTAAGESVPGDEPVAHVEADPEDPRGAVERALALLRGGDGRTVVGVDPGQRPGVAVVVDGVVTAAFHVPLADAVETIREEVAGEPDALVRIGDGARVEGSKILNELADVTVELVDETGTTPYLGTGARGMGDVLAAVNIAGIEGGVVEHREVDPTQGELDVIKTRSRDRSEHNRAIDDALARRVARGDLTIDEALAAHRGDHRDGDGDDGNDGDTDDGKHGDSDDGDSDDCDGETDNGNDGDSDSDSDGEAVGS